MSMKTPAPLQYVEKIEVIKIVVFIGDGTEKNPNRNIEQYWSLDGKLLAVVDPMNPDSD